MHISKEQNEAANDILKLIASKLENENKEINTLDAISTCARLAGSLLFRSFDYKISDAKPGSVILSEEANEKGPILVNITYAVLESLGANMDNEKMSDNSDEDTTLSYIDAINLVQNGVHKIMNRHALSFEELAYSTAIATAVISDISNEAGFSKAVYYYIEGSKTYPPDFTDSQTANVKENKKPWWKIW
ncbi:MAG: hypothetical protein K1X55_03680 [Chitinophagales bacterium]|nr:hypothetical protein [Chitinophagales bacterium]